MPQRIHLERQPPVWSCYLRPSSPVAYRSQAVQGLRSCRSSDPTTSRQRNAGAATSAHRRSTLACACHEPRPDSLEAFPPPDITTDWISIVLPINYSVEIWLQQSDFTTKKNYAIIKIRILKRHSRSQFKLTCHFVDEYIMFSNKRSLQEILKLTEDRRYLLQDSSVAVVCIADPIQIFFKFKGTISTELKISKAKITQSIW